MPAAKKDPTRVRLSNPVLDGLWLAVGFWLAGLILGGITWFFLVVVLGVALATGA